MTSETDDDRPETDALLARAAAGEPAAAAREEMRQRLERALERLDAVDREVISLRHYEQLSNVEIARELSLETSAASKRHMRAIKRLGELMEGALDSGGGKL